MDYIFFLYDLKCGELKFSIEMITLDKVACDICIYLSFPGFLSRKDINDNLVPQY